MPSGAGHDAQMLARVCPTANGLRTPSQSTASVPQPGREHTRRRRSSRPVRQRVAPGHARIGPIMTMTASRSIQRRRRGGSAHATRPPRRLRHRRGPARPDRTPRAARVGRRPPASACSNGPTGEGSELVAFPELALTTFFPRWYVEGEPDLDLDSVLRDRDARTRRPSGCSTGPPGARRRHSRSATPS